MVLPLPRASISAARAPPCSLAHTGSASMASGLSAGGFPSKTTVPVTVDAATATPGQPNTATSPAANHNMFRVPRMLSSLVFENLISAPPSTRPSLEWAELYTGSAHGATTLATAA